MTPVNVGSSLTLACVAYGDLIPTISWNKGSSQLTNDSEVTIYQEVLNISGLIFAKSILEICALDEDDAGQYSCFAESSTSNDTANFELSVTNRGSYIYHGAVVMAASDLHYGSHSLLLVVQVCIATQFDQATVCVAYQFPTKDIHLKSAKKKQDA